MAFNVGPTSDLDYCYRKARPPGLPVPIPGINLSDICIGRCREHAIGTNVQRRTTVVALSSPTLASHIPNLFYKTRSSSLL